MTHGIVVGEGVASDPSLPLTLRVKGTPNCLNVTPLQLLEKAFGVCFELGPDGIVLALAATATWLSLSN